MVHDPDSGRSRRGARLPFVASAAGLFAVTAAVLAFVLTRDEGESDVYSEYVTEDDVDPWPLTVPAAELHCAMDGAVTVTVDETTYAVNGIAESGGHPALDPVWAQRENAASTGGGPEEHVPVGALISRALMLCNAEMAGDG